MPDKILLPVKLVSACCFGMLIFIAIGCSMGKSPVEPMSPEPSGSPTTLQKDHGDLVRHSLLGYWQVSISEDKAVEIIPQRETAMHLNVLGLLEGGLCQDCLVIEGVEFHPDNIFSAIMVVHHPFPQMLEYTVFDVRGIFISGGVYDFPQCGGSMAWSDSVLRVLSYDGYTNLFNPTEFPQTNPPALGYIPGHKATGGDLSATLNPFVTFERDNQRSMFGQYAFVYRNIQVYAKNHPIQFGYAVDANWQLVEGPIDDPINQFPPDANCLEAYRIDAMVGDGIEAGGGTAPIQVKVYDHQGLDTIVSVTAEAPSLFSGVVDLNYSYGDPETGWYMYTGAISNDNDIGFGEYPVLIRVADSETDQNLGPIDAWQVYILQIKRGWAKTWGGGSSDVCYASAINPADNIYIAGSYCGIVDFDPGVGVDKHISTVGMNYTADAYISCFDSSGIFQWARTWGGIGSETCFDIAIDATGYIYVTGFYTGTADFDPGVGTDNHTSNGLNDAFLSKFDQSGNFLWTRSWGGTQQDVGYGVAVDNVDGVYVTGAYQGNVDFDPGAGEDLHQSNGSQDVYMTKFDSSGSFQWARTWGGALSDSASSIAINSIGQIHVSGSFRGSLDFDPGAGSDVRTSAGGTDAFLSLFTSSGVYLEAYTWGGTQNDYGDQVVVDTSDNVYTVGVFYNSADLDPTGGTDIHFSNGLGDGYLIKFNSTGAFQWAKSWGGVSADYPLAVNADNFSGVSVTGRFYDTVDFDPGVGVDNHTSYGLNDVFLSKFDSSGNYQWARTWGGMEDDYGTSVVADSLGNLYVAGYFKDVVDFDACSGLDIHTSLGDSDIFLCKYPPDGIW
ncbi:MAG: hypothetical protein NTY09_03650 [bacterium]|nr:hypothetical protein [bacterium]